MYSIQSVLKVMPTSPRQGRADDLPGHGEPIQHGVICGRSRLGEVLDHNIKYQINTTSITPTTTVPARWSETSQMVRPSATTRRRAAGAVREQHRRQGSYAAEVITKAQAAMPAVVTGTQNVIIFLSDGAFNADSDRFASGYSGKASNECKQAVEAAQAATLAGTKVYSVAYGARLRQRLQQLRTEKIFAEIHRLHDHASDRL
jgi:hypothetical protein